MQHRNPDVTRADKSLWKDFSMAALCESLKVLALWCCCGISSEFNVEFSTLLDQAVFIFFGSLPDFISSLFFPLLLLLAKAFP